MLTIVKAMCKQAKNSALRGWLAQRLTAGVISLFTLAVLAQMLLFKGPLGYDKWASIFFTPWMRMLTALVFVALAWHVWLGMREIYMDYIKPAGVRLALHIFTAVWLVASVAIVACVLWRIK